MEAPAAPGVVGRRPSRGLAPLRDLCHRLRPRQAQRRTYRHFDAACAWLVQETTRPGPILARHPGEVFWLTGRRSLSPSSNDPESIDGLIDRFDVAYVLIDEDRYANSEVSPLSHYVARRPHRVREVWKSGSDAAPVVIYQCEKSPRDRN